MHVLSWHQVDFAGVVLTGLIAGYVMAIAGLWAGATPGLVWAMLIVPNFPWPRPLVGIAWGVFLALALAGGLIVPLSGLGFMGRKSGGLRFAATTLLLHALWGVMIGLLYTGS
jgi:hypothetical protein